jgi:hypothetical protein
MHLGCAQDTTRTKRALQVTRSILGTPLPFFTGHGSPVTEHGL